MRRTWVVGIGALAVALGVPGPQSAVSVRPGESIQRAIDLAPPGAVIALPPGVWEENLLIGKPLTLRGAGAGRSVIRAREPGQPVLRIAADLPIAVRIEELAVGGGRFAEPFENHGVLVGGQARLTLTDCAVEGNEWHGVLVQHEAQAFLIRCLVAGNWVHGVAVEGGAAGVSECTIEGNGAHGIGVLAPGPVTIKRTAVRGNGSHGIAVAAASAVTIKGCTVEKNGWSGVLVGGSADVTLVGNQVLRNGEYGVALHEAPCSATEGAFTGRVFGHGNAIPAPGDTGGNALGAVCPPDLEFLVTGGRGTLDRGK